MFSTKYITTEGINLLTSAISESNKKEEDKIFSKETLFVSIILTFMFNT